MLAAIDWPHIAAYAIGAACVLLWLWSLGGKRR